MAEGRVHEKELRVKQSHDSRDEERCDVAAIRGRVVTRWSRAAQLRSRSESRVRLLAGHRVWFLLGSCRLVLPSALPRGGGESTWLDELRAVQ